MTQALSQAMDAESVRRRCLDVKRAIEAQDDALAQKLADALLAEFPGHPMALVMMGHVLRVQQKHHAMAAIGRELMAKSPESADMMFLLGLGSALYHLGELKESILYYLKGIQFLQAHPEPDAAFRMAEFFYGIGICYESLGIFDKARTYYGMALAQQGDHGQAIYAMELLKIKISDLRHGFDQFDTRHLVQQKQQRFGHGCPRWKGEDLAGKRLVVWSEQGVGDMVMFGGFIPHLLEVVSHLAIEITASMAPVLARSFPQAEVIATEEFEAAEQVRSGYDYCTPMGDLLRLLKDYQPRSCRGYIVPDAQRTAELKARYRAALGEGKLVGISWRTIEPNTMFRRNIPLELWGEVLRVPGCRFVSLQYSGELEERAYAEKTLGVSILWDETLDTMKRHEDYFAQVAAMDAVVSIQNSTVHAGGGLGIPTLLLLPKASDYRWGVSSDENVWYPSVEMVRQQAYGDWKPELARAAGWLRAVTGGER